MKREAIREKEIARIYDMSSRFALLGGLSPEQMHMILTNSEILRAKKGDYILEEGILQRKSILYLVVESDSILRI